MRGTILNRKKKSHKKPKKKKHEYKSKFNNKYEKLSSKSTKKNVKSEIKIMKSITQEQRNAIYYPYKFKMKYNVKKIRANRISATI